nr:hypothetical protein Iba_chr02aCG15510 [Ipomoea batatas]
MVFRRGWVSNKELGVSGWVKSKLGGCLEWAFGCSRVGAMLPTLDSSSRWWWTAVVDDGGKWWWTTVVDDGGGCGRRFGIGGDRQFMMEIVEEVAQTAIEVQQWLDSGILDFSQRHLLCFGWL